MLRRIQLITRILAALGALTASLSPGSALGSETRGLPVGSVKRPEIEVPAEATELQTILRELSGSDQGQRRGALLWLLRRNGALDLPPGHSFPDKAVRFDVVRFRAHEAEGIAWHLVECEYFVATDPSGQRGVSEDWRVFPVDFLFSGLGQLRDWHWDHKIVEFADINGDGWPELVSDARSAVRPPAVVRHTETGPAFWIRFRVLVTRYERGRSRDVLYVDDVFSPDLHSPVELCDPQRAGEPKAIWGCGRAPFVWDAQLERYVPSLVQREPGG